MSLLALERAGISTILKELQDYVVLSYLIFTDHVKAKLIFPFRKTLNL